MLRVDNRRGRFSARRTDRWIQSGAGHALVTGEAAESLGIDRLLAFVDVGTIKHCSRLNQLEISEAAEPFIVNRVIPAGSWCADADDAAFFELVSGPISGNPHSCAALVPRTRANLTRYHRVFVPSSPFRKAVVPVGSRAVCRSRAKAATVSTGNCPLWRRRLSLSCGSDRPAAGAHTKVWGLCLSELWNAMLAARAEAVGSSIASLIMGECKHMYEILGVPADEIAYKKQWGIFGYRNSRTSLEKMKTDAHGIVWSFVHCGRNQAGYWSFCHSKKRPPNKDGLVRED